MSGWWQFFWHYFAPHSRSLGWECVTGLTLGLITLLVAVSIIPQRFSGPVLKYERWIKSIPWAQKAFLLWTPLAIALLPFALLILFWHPRTPYVLRIESLTADPGLPLLWEDQADKPPRGIPELDLHPLIQSVLAQAATLGAVGWSPLEPDHRRVLGELCAVALKDFALGKTFEPSTPPPRLPRCVEETVEMTLVDGARALRNVVWTGVHAGPTPSRQGWNLRADDGTSPSGTEADAYHIFVESKSKLPIVHALTNGKWDPVSKSAQFLAVVQVPAGTPGGTLTFQLLQSGSKAEEITATVGNSPEWQAVTVSKVNFDPPSAAAMSARTVDGRNSTPLVRQDVTAAKVPTSIATSSTALREHLERTINGLLEEDGKPTILALDLASLGALAPDLTAPAASSVQVIIRDSTNDVRDILILAPGLSLSSIESQLGKLTAAPSSSAAPGVKNHSLHVSDVPGSAPNLNSWMSIAVPPLTIGGTEKSPKAGVGLAIGAAAVPVGTAVLAGRFAGYGAVAVPVVETGSAADGKRFVAIRLAPEEQGLLLTPTTLPPNYEPSRARAAVAACVLAINLVTSTGPLESKSDGVDNDGCGVPLLSDLELQQFKTLGRAGSDAVAIGIFGLYLVFSAAYYGLIAGSFRSSADS